MVEEILLSPLYFLNLHSLAFINVDAYILGKKLIWTDISATL